MRVEMIEAAKTALVQDYPARAEVLLRMCLEQGLVTQEVVQLLGETALRFGLTEKALELFKKASVKYDGPLPPAVVSPPDQPRYHIIKPWGYGFWSDVDHVLGQLLVAEITGRIPIVEWGDASLYWPGDGRDAWQLVFQPVSPGSIETVRPLVNGPESVFPHKWVGPNFLKSTLNRMTGDCSHISGLYFLARPEPVTVSDFHTNIKTLAFWIPKQHPLQGKTVPELYRYLCQKYLRLQPEVAEEIAAFKEAHFQGRKVLAVHIRGTDKTTEAKKLLTVNEAIRQEAGKLMKKLGANYLFLLTDEASVVEQFRSTYGAALLVTNATRSQNRPDGLHYQPDHPKDKLAKEIVIDTYLAAAADGFIGFGFSNVGAMVSHLKDWPAESLVLVPPHMHYQLNPFILPPR